jgi:hypothetical protein
MLQLTVSRPVWLDIKPHLGPKTRSVLLSDSCVFVNVGRTLWKDGSAVHNYCWPSPAQSFSCRRPMGTTSIFYCFRFETSPNWRARSPYLYPTGTGRSTIPPSASRNSSIVAWRSHWRGTTENTVPSRTFVVYVAQCDTCHCWVTIYCAIT